MSLFINALSLLSYAPATEHIATFVKKSKENVSLLTNARSIFSFSRLSIVLYRNICSKR